MTILAVLDRPDALLEAELAGHVTQTVYLEDDKPKSASAVFNPSLSDLYEKISSALKAHPGLKTITYLPQGARAEAGWEKNVSGGKLYAASFGLWHRLGPTVFHETRLGCELPEGLPLTIRPGQIVMPAGLFVENSDKLMKCANPLVHEIWIQLTALAKHSGIELAPLHARPIDSDETPYCVCGKIRWAFPLLDHHELYVDGQPNKLDHSYANAFLEEAAAAFFEARSRREKEIAEPRLHQPSAASPSTARSQQVFPKTKTVDDQSTSEPVHVCITSFPARFESLKKVIGQIEEKVDHIHLHLNQTNDAPDFIAKNPKITVSCGDDYGAAGKMRWIEDIEDGYVFILDDDNNIPPDYFARTIGKINQYEKRAAITWHGSVLKEAGQWYYEKYALYGYQQKLENDRLVNLCGSGFTAFHSSLIKLKFSDFLPYTMVDLALSLKFAEAGIPVICAQRPMRWLTQVDAGGTGLWHRFRGRLTIHSLVLESHREMISRKWWRENLDQDFPLPESGFEGWNAQEGNVSEITGVQNLNFQTRQLTRFYEMLEQAGIKAADDEIAGLQQECWKAAQEIADLRNSLVFQIGSEVADFGDQKSIGRFFRSSANILRLLAGAPFRK